METADDEEEEEVHTRSALNIKPTTVLYYHIDNKNDYFSVKRSLSISDFQMYIFLRVQDIADSYMVDTLQITRNYIQPYVYDMDWYNAYVAHVQSGKEIWQQ